MGTRTEQLYTALLTRLEVSQNAPDQNSFTLPNLTRECTYTFKTLVHMSNILKCLPICGNTEDHYPLFAFRKLYNLSQHFVNLPYHQTY